MSDEVDVPEILRSIGEKINEATDESAEPEPMDSEIIILSLFRISSTNQKLLRRSLDIYISYFDNFEEERNKDHEIFNNIISKSLDSNISPFVRFDSIRPLLYILHCLSDSLISSIIHNLVTIFNQMFLDPADLSKVPFIELCKIKKHYLNDYTFSDKLLASCYDYIHDEFECSNSPGSALAFGLIIQQLQNNHISAEFTDRLIKFCFKSDVRFQCIGCFLFLSYAKSDEDFMEVIPRYIFDCLKVFLISENKTLQIISCKAARYLISEHVFDDIDYFKPLLQQYSYYDDLFLYQRLISSFINSITSDFYDDKEENANLEILKYLSNFLHEQLSNEKTKISEKDTFLYFAGIFMIHDSKSYGKYYEDDIQVAVDLIKTGKYFKGPATYFAGCTFYPNRTIFNIIIENVPKLMEYGLNVDNPYRTRRSVTDSIAFITSLPDFKVLLPQLIKFRDQFIEISDRPIDFNNPEERGAEQIPCQMVIAFLSLIPFLSSKEAVDVGNLITRALLSTTDSNEFEDCLRIHCKLMKAQKISYTVVTPVVSAIIENQLPVFFEIPVYLYNGDSTCGESAKRLSKFLATYIKTAASQNAIDSLNPLIEKVKEWLPLSIDFTFITVLRPIVELIKLKLINDNDEIEGIIGLLYEIPQIVLPKDFPEVLSAASEALSLLFESHPSLFQVSKLLDFCNNIELDEFDDVEEEEEAAEEEEDENGAEDHESRQISGAVVQHETSSASGQQAQDAPRRDRRNRRSESSSGELIFSSSTGIGNNINSAEDDIDDLDEACSIIYPFKVKIIFLCFILKNLNSIDEEVQCSLTNGFEYMFSEPKLGISPSLLNLSLQMIKMKQSAQFRNDLCTTIIDFIFQPIQILKKHGINDGIEKEAIDKLVSVFKEQNKLYNSVKNHCQLDRSKYMMFNTYFRKLD